MADSHHWPADRGQAASMGLSWIGQLVEPEHLVQAMALQAAPWGD